MILFPPAKVNLGLYITGKRADGYHDIESVMYPLPMTDVLEILPAEKFSFKCTGIPVDGDPEDNLCVKAFRLLQSAHNIGNVMIHLRKNIPMGAGLGGGSADASFVLTGLNELFDLKLKTSLLEEYAAQLGSDCAFFIKAVPQLAKGRGEVLSPINISLKGKFLKVINPGIHISTKLAYSNVQLSEQGYDWSIMPDQGPSAWKGELRNDFEASVFIEYPQLGEIKNGLYSEGAQYACMSGSGSTMIGIFDEKPDLSGGFPYEKVLEL